MLTHRVLSPDVSKAVFRRREGALKDAGSEDGDVIFDGQNEQQKKGTACGVRSLP